MLRKIVSGGQTGADLGALRAEKILGLETGGWVPLGCRTRAGPNSDLVKMYGCQEHPSSHYAQRTYANVKDSDGTLRFAVDFNSPGERCTFQAIQRFHKPYYDVLLVAGVSSVRGTDGPIVRYGQGLREWLEREGVEVLNVAGHSEHRCPGIEKFVTEFLVKLLGWEKWTSKKY